MTEQAPLPAAELAAIEERLRRRAILHSVMGGHETGVKDMAALLAEVKRLQVLPGQQATIARLERQLAEANENATKAWGEVERLRAEAVKHD